MTCHKELVVIIGVTISVLLLTIGVKATVLDELGNANELVDFCQSPVYCQGELLKTVQLSEIYPDSKTFVDLYQKHDEDVTVANFEKLMKATSNQPSKKEVENFVLDNFALVDELENATLPDWQENPAFLSRIQDSKYRDWAAALNRIWKDLAKRMTIDVRDHPKRHSLIYVKNTFIIPGGRFREFYYWDSYWAAQGLLLHGMHDTVRGMIENFLSIVNIYGFIPNGGRVYYLMRSQLPILIPLIDNYYEVTKDWNFIDESLPTLEKEFNYWQRFKLVKVIKDGQEYTLARYFIRSEGPRPESFREDYWLAQNVLNPEVKRVFYNDIKAAAESGWDFSCRWFATPDGEPSVDLKDIITGDIIPVELNAFLEKNARILAGYFRKKGDNVKVKYYTAIAKQYREAIESVLWNEDDGTWYDYDTRHQKPRKLFFPTNLTPLYTLSYDPNKTRYLAQRSVDYLLANRITDYPGGIPSSLNKSGQQWDFPNAWPNLQSIVVFGLRRTRYGPALKVAKTLALTWLKSNYIGFLKSKTMFEKYDVTEAGKYGGGGEYKVQEGFGWTNGVVLEFLNAYPQAICDLKDVL